jgi:glucosamine-6-phosphate deaminase
MRIRVFDSETEASEAIAERITSAVRAKPELVLGLPTGRTPLGLYRELVARSRRGELDFSKVRTFNLDEFVGVDAEDPGSFRAFMERHLFREVPLAPERIGFLDGKAPDPAAECARYEEQLEAAGRLDLLILGLGVNGHIAFNEPADALQARTHLVKLTRESRVANAPLFGDDPMKVPLHALTMGMASILQARSLVLMAFGASKVEAVRGLLQGPVTPRLPASFLQLHADVEVVLDRAAAV